MVPQNGDNNADTWLTFETYQRELTERCRSVEVISGPVFEPTKEIGVDPKDPNLKAYYVEYKVLGRDGVAVPNHLYKLIKCNMGNEVSYASAFEFPNRASNDNNKKLLDFEVPIDELERRTGLTFNLKFPKSLVDYDFSVLSMRKEDYDKQSLYPRILNATRYDSITGELRKLKAHKIKEQDLLLRAKIE